VGASIRSENLSEGRPSQPITEKGAMRRREKREEKKKKKKKKNHPPHQAPHTPTHSTRDSASRGRDVRRTRRKTEKTDAMGRSSHIPLRRTDPRTVVEGGGGSSAEMDLGRAHPIHLSAFLRKLTSWVVNKRRGVSSQDNQQGLQTPTDSVRMITSEHERFPYTMSEDHSNQRRPQQTRREGSKNRCRIFERNEKIFFHRIHRTECRHSGSGDAMQ